MPRSRSRQQRRAHARRPRAPRRYGSRLFAVAMVALIVGGLFAAYVFRSNPPPITRGAIVGEHWHAAYRIYICGQRMTNYPTVEGEIHSHGDGFIHMHPHTQIFSNENANLGNFLRLFETLIGQQPDGTRSLVFPDGTRYQDGDECPDGSGPHDVEVLLNGEAVEGDPALLTPHDGDRIVIRFGPEGNEPLPNPYSAVRGIPDLGFGQEAPVPDEPAPDAPLPQEPPPDASPEASPGRSPAG